MPDEQLTVVYQGDVFGAQRAWSTLRGHGVSASLEGAGTGTVYSGARLASVLVPNAQLDAAREVLAASGVMRAD